MLHVHMCFADEPFSVCANAANYKKHMISCRQVGRELFRQELLGRHGKLVLVDRLKPEATVEEVVACLEPILIAAAGGSLDLYRN